MQKLKHDEDKVKQLLPEKEQAGDKGFSYVRISEEGRIIAVFQDETELDVSEMFTISMIDD